MMEQIINNISRYQWLVIIIIASVHILSLNADSCLVMKRLLEQVVPNSDYLCLLNQLLTIIFMLSLSFYLITCIRAEYGKDQETHSYNKYSMSSPISWCFIIKWASALITSILTTQSFMNTMFDGILLF